MLQSVRGSSQYWYRRKVELRCMLREWGPPSLFLTLCCAEYAFADIEEYLRKVNYVPSSYNIKVCTEDPISVCIKFSEMFHAFFKTIIHKGWCTGQSGSRRSIKLGEHHTTISYCGATMLQLLVWTHQRRCWHGSRRESHVKREAALYNDDVSHTETQPDLRV